MAIPEKHRAVAHAFVDGAQIQARFLPREADMMETPWVDCDDAPSWYDDMEYRVKPTAPALRLPAEAVDAIASYYLLMPATVEAVAARVLRDACELQVVVPMPEVQEVARKLAGKRVLATLAMYSTEELALRAYRNKVERRAAEALAAIDQQVADLRSAP